LDGGHPLARRLHPPEVHGRAPHPDLLGGAAGGVGALGQGPARRVRGVASTEQRAEQTLTPTLARCAGEGVRSRGNGRPPYPSAGANVVEPAGSAPTTP